MVNKTLLMVIKIMEIKAELWSQLFMAIGIRKNWKQPLAFYFSGDCVTADRLSVLIKEVLDASFQAGLNVTATVSDNFGVNIKALNSLGSSVAQPYFDYKGHEIVTIMDPPHLIKCFKNNLLKYDIKCPEVFQNNGKSMPDELPQEATTTAMLVEKIDQLFDALNGDTPDRKRGKIFLTNFTRRSQHLNYFKEMKTMFQKYEFIGARCNPPSQEGFIRTLNAVERLFLNLENEYNTKFINAQTQSRPIRICCSSQSLHDKHFIA